MTVVAVVDGPVDSVNEVVVDPGAVSVMVNGGVDTPVTVVDEESSATVAIPTTTTTTRTTATAASVTAGRRVPIWCPRLLESLIQLIRLPERGRGQLIQKLRCVAKKCGHSP